MTMTVIPEKVRYQSSRSLLFSIRKTASVFCLLLAVHNLPAQIITRDLNLDLLTNQVGYTPQAKKKCLLRGSITSAVDVIEIVSGKVAFSTKLVPHEGDFGIYSTADFSAVSKAGKYYLRADTFRSYPFEISPAVYQQPINLILSYFSKQRCGASETGYLSPCHLDDGIRVDNGRHQDVTGGWHDASDLRKWVSATIYGVIGLARACELQPATNRAAIIEEIKWGNQYFLKMQEPAGYVMNFIGGDLQKHSDNNRWTNNIIEKESKEIALILPTSGKSKQPMLSADSSDDRIIQTQPVALQAQYNFITAQALVARLTAKSDPAYSRRCLQAAKKCFAWCTEKQEDTTAINAGAAMEAAVEMFKATNEKLYRVRIDEIAEILQQLQMSSSGEGVPGYFNTSINNPAPFKNIKNASQVLISLCELCELFPKDKQLPVWKKMVFAYAEDNLLFFSKRNNFGIVPFGLFENEDPGGNRKASSYWYRYFMQPEEDWWVGINANLASSGIGLLKAGKLLNNSGMLQAAQSQLDWILGSNPLNSSTVVGVGYNQPDHFAGSSFLPTVPLIPGAVMNGLGGNHEDFPVKGKGDWQISEYWTPMVAYTLWLMAELN